MHPQSRKSLQLNTMAKRIGGTTLSHVNCCIEIVFLYNRGETVAFQTKAAKENFRAGNHRIACIVRGTVGNGSKPGRWPVKGNMQKGLARLTVRLCDGKVDDSVSGGQA